MSLELSIGEAEAFAWKAARASGYSWGMAEEEQKNQPFKPRFDVLGVVVGLERLKDLGEVEVGPKSARLKAI